jgi:protease-4
LKRKIIAGLIIGVIAVSLLAAAVLGRDGRIDYGKSSSEDAIGVIRINGMIVSGTGSAGLFAAVAGSESVMEQLRRAARDPSIKAVVLRLNTPGGTTAASQEIALEVDRLRRAGKKVVVSMGDVAASGGYWIASRCDKIVANPGSITGSIGVIMETQDLQGLYEKLGMDPVVFKSGPHKDMGSPARDITPEEQQIFQSMVDDMYEQFVDTVSDGRDLDPAEVRKLADGRVFTGSQALEKGLVDELGNFYDALDIAADLAGIRGRPRVVELAPEHSLWEAISRIKVGMLEFYPVARQPYNLLIK